MGRKSVKDDKNIYQQVREDLGLTREMAADILDVITADKIEKIENGKIVARPDEVIVLSKGYKKPELCNYYCTHECPIGIKYIPEVEEKDLSQITVEMLAALNRLEVAKNRFIEITVDGKISQDEKRDFETIRKQLADMSNTINSLSLWVEKALI